MDNNDITDLPQRKRLRLRDYDYCQGGAYFITINVNNNIPLLGKMGGQNVILNEVGGMVDRIWNEQPQHYPGVMVDAFVVMPNHIHGIIVLTDPKLLSSVRGSAWEPTPTLEGEISHDSHQGLAQRKPIDIPSLVGLFKSLTTKQYMEVKSEHPQSRLPEKLWQRSFYERVIRSENDLEEKRDYILTNPLRQVLKSQKTFNP